MSRAFSKILISIIFIAIAGGGFFAWQYFGAPERERSETTDWKIYGWNEISFEYPADWTVEKIYYQTPVQQISGETPENIGVRLYPSEIRGKDYIDIGGRQVSCEPSQNHTKCFYISSIGNFTFTDSENSEIINVFDLFVKTIKEVQNETAGWKTYRNEELGFEFKYPEKYIVSKFAEGRTPAVIINTSAEKIVDGCYKESQPVENYFQNKEITFNNITFCISKTADAGAGSTFPTYYYTTFKNGKYIILKFELRIANCGSYYGLPEFPECEKFSKNLPENIEKPIEKMISTFKFKQ